MRALDATVETIQPNGSTRSVPIADLHRLPGDTPHVETTLQPGELITAVTLPKPAGGTHIYHKVRDRASYAFALVSMLKAFAERKEATPAASSAGRESRCRADPALCRGSPRNRPRSVADRSSGCTVPRTPPEVGGTVTAIRLRHRIAHDCGRIDRARPFDGHERREYRHDQQDGGHTHERNRIERSDADQQV
jgi:hypothetical protein